jgi:ribosomal peptide maturation radical SAM protein 1
MTEQDVLLINMPFGPLLSPSIGLGLLKAALARTGVRTKSFHFQIAFAKLIGVNHYSDIYDGTYTEDLAGEWVFSDSLFGTGSGAVVEDYVSEILMRECAGAPTHLRYGDSSLARLIDSIRKARSEAESFLCGCLEAVLSERPKVVGFTSLFHQHVASLALAKRVKEQMPEAFVVFGGPNCEGAMGVETLRQFEFVDAVVSGEGDFAFPALVGSVLASELPPRLQGVHARRARELPTAAQPAANTPTIENLDELPVPDYGEYFEQLEESGIRLPRRPGILFETSRGCWWGEKHHCTFCGLNGATMAFRSKTAARAYAELLELTERHPGCNVNVVDNILDMKYFRDFVPMLAARERKFNLFYEVKANLKKEQLLMLREAGIFSIQPGIESFSDRILRGMRKGVSALQNVQLLKWCKELGFDVYYHLIWGFPEEGPEDYDEMARMIPLISHLTPPLGAAALRVDRFSPNFDQAEQFGFRNLAPNPAYRHVYPFATAVLFNLAYFFSFEYAAPRDVAGYVRPLADEIARWNEWRGRSDLFWMESGEHLLIWDFRPAAVEPLVALTGHGKFAYIACDQIRTARQVLELWRGHSGLPLTHADVREALDSFVSKGLMLRQGESYLALAYPAPDSGASPSAVRTV